jgi:8-oxo-dGTP pyrophosphatase MutT (NUDIX family)
MKLLKIFDRRSRKIGYQPIIYRDSVRAIILKGQEILLVYSEKTDEYKFPGGGVEENEIKEYALRREVMEEVGHKINSVNESLGYTDQMYNDIYDSRKYFYLRSYYYFCEVYDEQYKQELDTYERDLKFVPRWVTLDEAIETNQRCFDNGSLYHWTERELYILKLLKEMSP